MVDWLIGCLNVVRAQAAVSHSEQLGWGDEQNASSMAVCHPTAHVAVGSPMAPAAGADAAPAPDECVTDGGVGGAGVTDGGVGGAGVTDGGVAGGGVTDGALAVAAAASAPEAPMALLVAAR